MARCPAHGNRIQLNSSRAVNLFGATPQTDCRRTALFVELPRQQQHCWLQVCVGCADAQALKSVVQAMGAAAALDQQGEGWRCRLLLQ